MEREVSLKVSDFCHFGKYHSQRLPESFQELPQVWDALLPDDQLATPG